MNGTMPLALIEQQVRLYCYVLDLAAAVNRVLRNVRSKCHPHFLLSLLKYTTMTMIALRLCSSLNARHDLTMALAEQNVCLHYCVLDFEVFYLPSCVSYSLPVVLIEIYCACLPSLNE